MALLKDCFYLSETCVELSFWHSVPLNSPSSFAGNVIMLIHAHEPLSYKRSFCRSEDELAILSFQIKTSKT